MNHLRRAEEVVGQRLAIRRGGIGGVMFLRQQPCGTDEVFIVVRQSGAVAVEPTSSATVLLQRSETNRFQSGT